MSKTDSWYSISAKDNSAEIYIYDEIGAWGMSAKRFLDELKNLSNINDITLHINSPGGSVFDGMAIYNQIKSYDAQVTVYVDGLAASMASVIAMAGDLVVMPENAMMMIHNPWMVAVGDADELRSNAEMLDKVKKAILSAYAEKTGLSSEEIGQIMDEETWLTGAEAKDLGFADEADEAVDIAASVKSFDLSNFKKNPFSKLPAVAGSISKKQEGDMPQKDTATTTVDNAVEVDNAVSAALQKENDRKAGIASAFGSFSESHGELLNSCLLDSTVTVEDAQAKLLKAMGEGAAPVASAGVVVAVDDQAQNAIKAMGDVLASRTGLAHDSLENNPYRASTLLDMANQCLAKRGISVAGMDKMSVVASAFTHTSSDFGNILKSTANKSMLKGYDEVEEVFERFTSVGNLPDFKEMERVGLNAAPSLRQVREGAEFKSVTLGDRGEKVQLATYGELFGITRQAIINDDLSVFTTIPQRFGRAARRTVGDLVFSVLTGNQIMSDGKALFHADHNNTDGNALAVSAVDALRVLMGLHKDPSGNANLNIRPSFLLVPRALESTAKVLMASETDPTKSNSRLPNPVSGTAEVLTDSRLDAASAAAWYMLASAQMHDVIEVQYLDGVSTPFLDQQAGWNVDGVQFKVRMDAGAKALDYRTIARGGV